ncbi:MAG: hypothetical protein L0170_13560, partial [Acidobacteria bacterium]|nr:hypothetical protein [Acidobacteriota bacterium]
MVKAIARGRRQLRFLLFKPESARLLDSFRRVRVTDPEASVRFPALGCEIALSEIYANVELPAGKLT